MNKIVSEIQKGKNLSENIPKYGKKVIESYHDLSFIRLSMNYFTYYEVVKEGGKLDNSLNSLLGAFNNIVKETIISQDKNTDYDKYVKELDSIRNKIIDIMKGLTSYVDIFNIYEYCLNRVEYKFKDGNNFLQITDADMTNQLMNYIVSDNDNVVINGKIGEIVRQLPLRMTKNRFFQLLKEGIKVYTGSEISGLEDYLYLLKTSSMAEISPFIEILNPDLKVIYSQFKNVNFSNLTEDHYNDLKNKLSFVVDHIERSISMYMTLEELINDLYTILLGKSNEDLTNQSQEICRAVIMKINEKFIDDQLMDIYDSVADDFTRLEGEQEKLQRLIYSHQNILQLILSDYQDILLEDIKTAKMFDDIGKMEILTSGSIFVEFTERNNEIATKEYVLSKYEELEKDLKDLFTKNNKYVNRAVMAHVLSGLPVFFNNIDEIVTYIQNSFEQCGDQSEKAAAFEIFLEMISEEF